MDKVEAHRGSVAENPDKPTIGQLEKARRNEAKKLERDTRRVERQKKLKWRQRRHLMTWWSSVLALWLGMSCIVIYTLSKNSDPKGLPTVSDLATIFFGTSSLALLIVSLVLAFVAIIGWNYVKEEVKKEIKTSEEARHELRSVTSQNKEFMETLTSNVESRFKRAQEQAARSAEEAKGRANDLEHEVRANIAKAEMDIQAQADKIRDEIQDRLEKVAKEIKGRSNLTSGHTLATSVLSRIHFKASDLVKSSPVTSNLDRNIIEEAIYVSRKGYRDLKEAGTNGQYAALNNVVYYSCVLRLDENRDELLSQAKEIKAAAETNKSLPWSVPYFVTFCWVILIYGASIGETAEALKIGEEILARPNITSIQKEEATDIVASLKEKLKKLLTSNGED